LSPSLFRLIGIRLIRLILLRITACKKKERDWIRNGKSFDKPKKNLKKIENRLKMKSLNLELSLSSLLEMLILQQQRKTFASILFLLVPSRNAFCYHLAIKTEGVAL